MTLYIAYILTCDAPSVFCISHKKEEVKKILEEWHYKPSHYIIKKISVKRTGTYLLDSDSDYEIGTKMN